MPRADLLLITVNEHESNAVLGAFETATKKKAKAVQVGSGLYHYLGVIKKTKVYHAISQMGSGGPGGAQQTVNQAINDLHPAAVVAVGIAFGTNEEKQSFGDILVSEKIRLYEPQRIGERIIPRGDRPPASSALLRFFGMARASWRGQSVRAGLILTGDKLVDDFDFRAALKELEQEAIGGDMEAEGIYSACHEAKIDWIIVKAICDFADGDKNKNKEARQKLAATNAAKFVLHALQNARLPTAKDPWYSSLGILTACLLVFGAAGGALYWYEHGRPPKNLPETGMRLPFSQVDFVKKLNQARLAGGAEWEAFRENYVDRKIQKWTCKLKGELALDPMDKERGMSGIKVIVEGEPNSVLATCYWTGAKKSSQYRDMDKDSILTLIEGTLEQVKPDGSIRLADCVFDP